MEAYEADIKKSQLKRVLGKWSLTAIGIGAIIGGGIFVLTGTGAYYNAGPALALSFVIAGIACVFAALCYAEFASILPVEGSAYAYAYGTVGEIFAWIIGWGLILEYAMGSMTVAVSWSGYFGKLLKMFGLHLPAWLTTDPQTYLAAGNSGFSMNLPAFLIVWVVIGILLRGTKALQKRIIYCDAESFCYYLRDYCRRIFYQSRELVAFHSSCYYDYRKRSFAFCLWLCRSCCRSISHFLCLCWF
jgi:APA family basic amino acid/polyamine antiporter